MIHRLKRLIKLSLAFLLYYSGVLHVLKRRKLKNNAVVLMYHRVIPAEQRKHSFSDDSIIVDDRNFDKHLKFLSRHFNILSIDSFIDHYDRQQPLPNASCLITFDDGWYDNYLYAWPILKNNNVPALIFMPTDFMESGRLFWQETLGHGFSQCLVSDHPGAKELLAEHHLDNISGCSADQQRSRINHYVRTLKSLDYEHIERLLARMQEILGAIDHGKLDGYLSKGELQEMQGELIHFGSHACSHRILTRLPAEERQRELSESRHILENILQRPVKTIAYPNGNFDDELCDMAEKNAYGFGFTTRFGYTSIEDDPRKIRRVNMNDALSQSRPLMLANILGIF